MTNETTGILISISVLRIKGTVSIRSVLIWRNVLIVWLRWLHWRISRWWNVLIAWTIYWSTREVRAWPIARITIEAAAIAIESVSIRWFTWKICLSWPIIWVAIKTAIVAVIAIISSIIAIESPIIAIESSIIAIESAIITIETIVSVKSIVVSIESIIEGATIRGSTRRIASIGLRLKAVVIITTSISILS